MKKTYHSRQLEGILCVDKPQDWTSFDVVAKMRGIADCHKIGHGGTLDPMATGVLPLFFGRSAKAMELMPVQDKRYTASIRFGVTTDTQDCTGNILSTSEKPVTKKALEAALAPLRGTIDQLPPIDFGRIAAQTAKQVIVQKVRDAERNKQFEGMASGCISWPGPEKRWSAPPGR